MAFLLVNDELKYKIVTTLIPTEDKLYKAIYVIWKSQNPIGLHVYTNTLLHEGNHAGNHDKNILKKYSGL